MNTQKRKINKEKSEWRKGYDLGVKTTLRENDIALKLGCAILDALDTRYELKEEDY
jgi:hypothetical protein